MSRNHTDFRDRFNGNGYRIGCSDRLNCEFKLYMTKEIKEELDKQWDWKTYPDTARMYPNPKNPDEMIKFHSRNEYILFVLWVMIHCSNLSWLYVSSVFNPYYLKKGE